MSQTDDPGDDEKPRVFPLVVKSTRNSTSSDVPSREPDVAPAIDTRQPVEHVEPREAVQQVENKESSEAVSNEVEADDFLHPREVILAREAIQVRHGRCASCLNKLVVEIDEKDATAQYKEEAGDNHIAFKSIPYSSDDDDEDTIVAWEEGDPENPYNWSKRKKNMVLVTVMMLIINSTMGSALPSNALPDITSEWDIVSREQMVLPISVYLIGYVMGPLLWAPLSEQFGRRRLTISTFSGFTLFTLACALAPNWPSFLLFRLFAGVFASAPIAIVPGIIADTQGDPRTRGRSMGLFFATTLMGPLFAPVISGYCSTTIGWRWAFWIALVYAGATMVPLAFLPETFGPVLLLRRTRAIRKADPTARVVAQHELEKKSLKQLATVVLTRPIRMILFEPIVNTSCAYLALCYAIFYMSFEAFPIIFQGLYGLSPGECGLTYLSIGVGCLIALPIFFAYDNILRRAQARNAPWTRQEEYRRLPLACIGGPLFAASLFWLGWTSHESVHFIVPVLAGIPFGLGFMCIFQALLNYLTDAYEIFAASANAAASCSRSLLATVLPLATVSMFAHLGIAGACSLLGGLATLMCIIPFVFLWQGERIRAGSKFCLAIRQRREEMARKIDDQRKRRTMRLASAESAATAVAETAPRTPATGATGNGNWSGRSTPVNTSGNPAGVDSLGARPKEDV